MFERNDDVLFVCYDNEGYMNTGVQRSGATPPAARTANTKALGPEPGNVFGQGKSVPLIAMAHEIPYVATATVADLRDLEYKVEKAMTLPRRPLPARVRALPARLGRGVRRTRSSSPGWPRRPGIFPVFEAEARRGHRGVHGSGGRSRSRTTCARRGATPTSSATPVAPTSSRGSRPGPTATSPASGCSRKETT